MKRAAWNIVSLLALLTVAAGATAAPLQEQAVDKTKDAVVKGVTVATDKTKEGLSKTGEVMTDEWITGRVHARFVGEDLLKDSDISVKTREHVVTLTGTVTARAGRSKAGKVALGTEGVHRVVNQLTIGSKHTD